MAYNMCFFMEEIVTAALQVVRGNGPEALSAHNDDSKSDFRLSS